jgi:hypothetical protein
MLNVVFTGPAFDTNGQSIIRANLIAACQKTGLFVQPAVKATTDVLVASRKDTVKAKTDKERGLKVLTYPEFISKFLAEVEIMSGGKPDKWCDAIAEIQVQDFTVGLDPHPLKGMTTLTARN